MIQLFRNRAEAGKMLAARLTEYADRDDVLVLALPRGGVPVAFEIAKRLAVPVDVFVVRKLGVPGHEELALGAIATGGIRVLDDGLITTLGLTRETVDRITARELKELQRRERAYRGHGRALELRGKTVLLVDDGIATGSTMKVALRALRRGHPERLIVVVPVAPRSARDALTKEADEVVTLIAPEQFYGVGQWYRDFHQTTDEEVTHLMAMS